MNKFAKYVWTSDASAIISRHVEELRQHIRSEGQFEVYDQVQR